MNFRQFAFNNVRRNARAYSAYFLSSSFAVMIFFAYAVFIFHPEIGKTPLGATAKILMQGAEYIIFVFSFLFVLYSNSAFLKVRQKEFGILTILGAAKGQINRLIFLENIIIGFASVITGIVGGFLLSQVFLYYGAKIMEVKKFSMYLPSKAIGITAASFLGLFLFISLLTTFFVRQNRVLELLQGAKKPKTEPKASILLSLLSILTIGTAIFIVSTMEFDEATMLYTLALGSIGTYFLYTQLSIYIIRLLKKNRLFFWRGANLLWISEMAYKLKDNARMFFMVTIITTVACSAVGGILSLRETNEKMYTANPFPISYQPLKDGNWQADVKKIDQTLGQAGSQYEKIKVMTSRIVFKEIHDKYGVNIIKQSDFNHLAKALHVEPLPLQPGEAIFVESNMTKRKEKLNHLQRLTSDQGNKKLKVIQQIESGMQRYVVVSDITYIQLKSHIKEAENKDEIEFFYDIPAWKNDQLPNSSSPEVQVGQKLQSWNQANLDKGNFNGFLTTRGGMYDEMKKGTAVIMFVGLFIAAIFSVSMASFLYFKLYTELNQDQQIYHGLSRIGLSLREMKKAATIQIASLFFIPLIIAGIETWIVLQSLTKALALDSAFLPVAIAISGFFVAQLIYFIVVRSRYVSQLNRVMV
ncbi:FtsX-like permease family protein [Thermoflavimicrobium daqui]|uniref:ABC transporter permease n=1 Tax=Thermoflavimicrobium daqui TaxID=2137476 RepID=A0A364K0V3_9BACL|nr:ABC transporter permease [Thermoflavimicrobium daqui]RAL21314.1 ABC transporter permease [Thermoflavimicrobium daqui]